MTKGIFVIDKIDKKKIEKIQSHGSDSIFTNYKNLSPQIIKSLKEKGFKIFCEIGIFPNLCPNDKVVRKNKLKEIKKIINLQIDGLWLDFIRFPLVWEVEKPDFKSAHQCPKCQGIKKRTEVINTFVSQVRSLINQSGKKLKLGIFSVPWREKDFDGSITKVLGQDFKTLARYIDIFSPMTYHKMCRRTLNWIHEIVNHMDKVTRKPILPIVQTEDKPERISSDEFRKELSWAVKPPSYGVVIFFLEDLIKDKEKVQVVQ